MDLESDFALVVSALAASSEDHSEIGRIVEDCKDYMSALHSFGFRHIYHEVNNVAHRFAHLASVSYIDDFWLAETPSIIEDVLYEDFCKCTRELSVTSLSMFFNKYDCFLSKEKGVIEHSGRYILRTQRTSIFNYLLFKMEVKVVGNQHSTRKGENKIGEYGISNCGTANTNHNDKESDGKKHKQPVHISHQEVVLALFTPSIENW